MSWYSTGKEGVERGKKKAEDDKLRRESRAPFKFRLKVGETKKATFLDDPNFFFSLHTVPNGKGGYDDFTCLNDTENCPLCERGDHASYVLAATIIDHTGYVDKEEKRHRHVKQLAIFKQVAQKRILKRKDAADGNSLKLCCLSFSRDGDKECSTGEEITFLKKLSSQELLKAVPKDIKDKGKEEIKKWFTPYDLEKIFKPKSVKELRALTGCKTPVGSVDEEELFGENTEKISEGDALDLGLDEGESKSENSAKEEPSIDDLI